MNSTEEKLAGLAVVVGARIAAAAGAGEILVSGTVRDLVAGSGLEFADRGESLLKGVPGTWPLYAIAESPNSPPEGDGRASERRRPSADRDPETPQSRARSSGDRALPCGGRGRTFESCRAHGSTKPFLIASCIGLKLSKLGGRRAPPRLEAGRVPAGELGACLVCGLAEREQHPSWIV